MLSRTLQISFGLALGSAQIASSQMAPANGLHFDRNSPITKDAPAMEGCFNGTDFLRNKATAGPAFALPQFDGGLRPGQLQPLVLQFRLSVASPERRDNYTDEWALHYRKNESFDDRVSKSLAADLSRFQPTPGWRIGGEEILSYNCPAHVWRVVLRCGPQFIPSSYGYDREHCVGLLFQFGLGKRKQTRQVASLR